MDHDLFQQAPLNIAVIDREYNIMGELRQKARLDNYVAVVGGERNYRRLQQLRGQKAEILAATEGKPDAGDRAILKEIGDEIRELDNLNCWQNWQPNPTAEYRHHLGSLLSEYPHASSQYIVGVHPGAC